MTKVAVPMQPEEHRVRANGLEHRVLEWPAQGASRADASCSTVFLVHGYMDAAGTWDRVAPALADDGFRVLAPDMRGFGDGERISEGSYYHFADYIADIAELIEEMSGSEPVALVGHSMGGTITTLYSGAFPENVVRLAILEGLGPPDNGWELGPVRMRSWIGEMRALRTRPPPAPLRREDARRRLVTNHPSVPRDVLDHRLPHLVKEVTDEEGQPRVMWRYDPLHRTTSPVPFFAKLFMEFAKLVTCPVLFVGGGKTGFHPPDEAERVKAFVDVKRVDMEGAGHMMHWTRPAELAKILLGFL